MGCLCIYLDTVSLWILFSQCPFVTAGLLDSILERPFESSRWIFWRSSSWNSMNELVWNYQVGFCLHFCKQIGKATARWRPNAPLSIARLILTKQRLREVKVGVENCETCYKHCSLLFLSGSGCIYHVIDHAIHRLSLIDWLIDSPTTMNCWCAIYFHACMLYCYKRHHLMNKKKQMAFIFPLLYFVDYGIPVFLV